MCVFCCAQRRLRALCCFRANHEKNASHTVGRVTPGHMKMKAQRADEKQEADESERQTAKVDKENEDRWVRVANCCVLSLTYFLLFFLPLLLFGPFSVIPFHMAQGTNKGNKTGE